MTRQTVDFAVRRLTYDFDIGARLGHIADHAIPRIHQKVLAQELLVLNSGVAFDGLQRVRGHVI